ncbi:MAG: hypothetical protein M0D55_08630 [Elusimicrobiota bacterium]|nr:MAG: hypothetical protein M0D55_08630 [Elusimicrobiota bacterium]
MRHPFQLTVETLRAIAGSRRIFTNLPDVEARRFLALFPGEVLSVPRRADKTNLDRAKWIVRRLRPGESAAFLTRIHPFIYRRMGWDLLELCRAKGIPARAFGAVSLTELAACRAFDEGAAPDPGTFRVFDIGHLNRNPDLLRPGEPTVIYCIGNDRDRPRLVRLLRRAYPAAGGAYVLGGSGDREDRAPWTPWRRLGIALRLADIGCVLYVPAGGKGAPARKGRGPVARLHGLGSRPGETTLETLAALDDGPGAVALAGPYPLAGAAARRLAARRAVRATPSVSPVASAFARAQFCLGGDYGYQGISVCEADRLLADPGLHTARLPLVVHGGRGTSWARVGALLAQRLPPGHLAHAFPDAGKASLVPLAGLGKALKGSGTALVPPTVPPASPDLS